MMQDASDTGIKLGILAWQNVDQCMQSTMVEMHTVDTKYTLQWKKAFNKLHIKKSQPQKDHLLKVFTLYSASLEG